jgi:DNA-binding CsgD family transcriptional regulator
MAGNRPRLPHQLPTLTERQEEVLGLIAKGRTNFEIAEHLGISLEGAKYHVREIMARLGAGSREEAVEAWRAERASRRSPAAWARRALALVGLRGVVSAGAAAVGIAGTVAVAAVFISGGSDPPAVAPDDTTAVTATATAGLGGPLTPVASGSPGTPGSTTFVPTDIPSRSETPTPLPTPPAVGPYPLGTRTGDPVVDAVIAAVEAGDADALFDLIHYTPAECDNPNQGQVQPPGTFQCPNGEPDGTEILVVFGEGSHGAYYPQGDPIVRSVVEEFLATDSRDPRVHSVLEERPGWAADERGVVFANGKALIIDAQGIVTFLGGTGLPENRIASATSFLLPPLPQDPTVYAEAVRDELHGIADAASLSEDADAGYGIFDAWEDYGFTIVPGDQVPVGRGEVSATAVELPPGTGGGYTAGIYFAVADDAGNCAGGFIAIAIPEGSPAAGFITFAGPSVAAGAPCTAEAVMNN